ncbi:MAG: phosphatase PAP2 family protein [Nitrospirota bacterium]
MKHLGIFLFTVLCTVLSVVFLDAGIALFFQKAVTAYSPVSLQIPDLLFPFVCIITVFSWGAYLVLRHRETSMLHGRFFLVIAWTVPAAFFLKSALKQVFGRVTTRYWLYHPDIQEFRWLQGGENYNGFPSGHMAVFAVLMCALWEWYPHFRALSLVFLLLLGFALLATDYHFLSDVIAGAYLGMITHIIARSMIKSLDQASC